MSSTGSSVSGSRRHHVAPRCVFRVLPFRTPSSSRSAILPPSGEEASCISKVTPSLRRSKRATGSVIPAISGSWSFIVFRASPALESVIVLERPVLASRSVRLPAKKPSTTRRGICVCVRPRPCRSRMTMAFPVGEGALGAGRSLCSSKMTSNFHPSAFKAKLKSGRSSALKLSKGGDLS